MKQGEATFSPIPPPLGLLLRVLAIVFLAEVSVMFLLPALLPHMHTLAAAIVDAAMLTVLSAPFLWWVVVRPLRSTAMAEHARAATVVAHAVDGIITINEQGLVQSFNPAAERIFGYRAEEVLGKPLTLVMPERYRDAHRRGLERMRSTGKSDLIGKTIGLQGLRKDGREFELELSLATWKAGTETSYYTGIVRDITERKRAEEALAQRTGQLEAVRGISEEIIRELDLTAALGLITRRAMELLGAPSGAVYLYDEAAQVLLPQAWHGYGGWMAGVRLKMDEGVTGAVAQQREGLIVNDYRASPYAHPLFLERTGITAVLSEPLFYRDKLVGVITINNEGTGQLFTQEDRQLLALFATQAAIAIENARLYAAAERAAHEARSLYEVAHSLTTSLDPTEVLHLISVKTAELLGTPHAQVVLWDEATRTLRLGAAHGTEAEKIKAQQFRLGEGVNGIVAQTRAPLIENEYQAFPHRVSWLTDLVAVIGVPLLYRGRLLGVLTSHATQPGSAFTQEQLALLTSFADQAASALENARLFAETQQRAAELETFREIDQAITARLELSAVLEAVVAGALRLLGTQHAQITLWDEATQTLRYGAAQGTEAERVRAQVFELGRGTNGTVAQTRQPLVLDDYQASPYALPEFPDLVATLTVPILFEDRLLGVLHGHTTQPGKRFTPDDLRRFQMLAGQAAIAIEQARLYEATVRQLRELRALHETGLAITSSLTLDEQLEVLIQRLGQVAQAQRILVALLDPKDPARFHRCLAHDATKPEPWLRHLDLSSARYPEIQDAMRTGQPQVIPDVAAEARLGAVRERLDLRSLIVVPLIVRERVIGAVSLGYVGQGRTFTPEEVSLLQSFATQAAIAIEKARLYQVIQHHAAELEQRVQERTRELEAANAQLQVASRHKSEFLANMSHELRTPLNSILGFAELVGEQRVGALNEKQARYLGHIHNSGKHLLQLISDILDLSKVEAGKVILRPEPLPIAGTLEDILVITRGLANKKQQELSAEIEANLPSLRADPVRFKQILFNLLSNAVKFTPEGGRITVTARRIADFKLQIADVKTPGSLRQSEILNLQSEIPGEFLEIQVTDTGVGIRAEDLPRLFQEFVQLETTQAQNEEGTGLGLALTKRLVDLHGGRIWAESAGEARGSTFTVLLPFRGPREGQGTSPGPTSSGGREWSEEEAGE